MLNGTWSYADADSNLTMKVEGTSIWPTSRTGMLAVSGNTATITYSVVDTISHGTSSTNGKIDTTSEIFIGKEVINMLK